MPGLPGCRGPVGEGVAAGVAEHMRMRLQLKASAGGGSLDHPGKAGRGERGSPLADEDKRRRLALALEPAEGPELVAAQGMGARGAVLDPPHMQGPSETAPQTAQWLLRRDEPTAGLQRRLR